MPLGKRLSVVAPSRLTSVARTVTVPPLPGTKGATDDLRSPGETDLLRLNDNRPCVPSPFRFSLGIGKDATGEAVICRRSLQGHLRRPHRHGPSLAGSEGAAGDLRSSGETDLLCLDDNRPRVPSSFRFSLGIGKHDTDTGF